MSETERHVVLKVGLLLAVFEGWTQLISVRARLGVDVGAATRWLVTQGYVEPGEEGVYRWRPQVEFEALWGQLIPDRRCPVTLCGSRRGTHTAACNKPVAH